MKPQVQFFGVTSIVSDITEVGRNACEPGVETCEPEYPHAEDTAIVVLDFCGDEPGEGVVVTIATERGRLDALADQYEALARKLRRLARSWSRAGVCVTCGTHAFDADNPPPTARCPVCDDTRFEIVDVATELRSAASGCGCGVHDTSRGKAVRA